MEVVKTAVTAVNGTLSCTIQGCWLILMKGACRARGHIYSHIYAVNQATVDEPPSISLCPTRRAPLSSYWMLTMSTPAPVVDGPPLWTAAIAHDGAGPQAGGTQLAGQNQPASVGGRLGHSTEEPGCLWRFITGHKSPLNPPLPLPRSSILQAECRLNQS